MTDVTQGASTPSRDQIQAAYTKLAAEVGDLYFQLDGARARVTALETAMTALKERRDALQKAFQEAPAEAQVASDDATPA